MATKQKDLPKADLQNLINEMLRECGSEHASAVEECIREGGERCTANKIVQGVYEHAMDTAPAAFDKLSDSDQRRVRRSVRAAARGLVD